MGYRGPPPARSLGNQTNGCRRGGESAARSIQIVGNLGGTPDTKFLNDDRSQVVNFSVAVNERWKNRDSDPQERTTWLRIVAFNGVG